MDEIHRDPKPNIEKTVPSSRDQFPKTGKRELRPLRNGQESNTTYAGRKKRHAARKSSVALRGQLYSKRDDLLIQ